MGLFIVQVIAQRSRLDSTRGALQVELDAHDEPNTTAGEDRLVFRYTIDTDRCHKLPHL